MGARGPRSAADLSTTRPNPAINMREPIDIPALARQHGMPQREVMRAIRRAERRGEAVSRISRDGRLQWFWCDPPDQQHGDEDLPPCCCRLR
jgi:hypothetical protein